MKYYALGLFVFCLTSFTGCNKGSPQNKEGINNQNLHAAEVSDSNTAEHTDPNNSMYVNFENMQKQLFYGIDHNAVYRDCQELMRLHREGELSNTIFYGEDSNTSGIVVPESIRSLQYTYVRVNEMMVDINFSSAKESTQSLHCFSNEFGEPQSNGDNPIGLGFRSNPFSTDKLSGKESLNYLNEKYIHFQIELIPGLIYHRFMEDQTGPTKDVRQSNEQMDLLMDFMSKTVNELAVKKQRLLHRTDPNELLKACRQTIVRYNNGEYSKAKLDFMDLPEEYISEISEEDLEEILDTLKGVTEDDLKKIPDIILDLKPAYIWFDNDSVKVALIGGMDHAGVTAYVNEEEAIIGDDNFKLIDGLLYYDDGLREASEDYKDYLDSLQNEAIPYLDWKRKQMNLPIPKRSK
ncbi:hypothetical protein ACFL6U_00900 [Planctomycetota bacterium]